MATLSEYQSTLSLLSRAEISQGRLKLFQTINGDAFYPLSVWPQEMKMTFWRKPIGEHAAFKLSLFFLRHGCSPYLFRQWIMLSQFWSDKQLAEKRARQLDFIFKNADTKRLVWFYYDLDYLKYLYLDGLPRDQDRQDTDRRIPPKKRLL